MSWFGRKKAVVRVHIAARTDTGQQREHNEDSFLVADLTRRDRAPALENHEHRIGNKGFLLLVADGMGGAAAGEIASEMATNAIFEHLATNWERDRDSSPEQFARRLREAIEAANLKIHAHAQENPARRGMGTTATGVGALGDTLLLSHVGDSRAYLVRGAKATQITKDQSLMQKLVDAGELTEEEAERSDRKNIILQALGPDPKVEVDLTHQPIRHGDVVVVCSDGLSGQVTKEEIAEAIGTGEDLDGACRRLIELANERGGPDNITIIAAKFDGALKTPGQPGDFIGHQAFPIDIDAEATTDSYPAVDGAGAALVPADRRRMIIAAIASALVLIAAMILAM